MKKLIFLMTLLLIGASQNCFQCSNSDCPQVGCKACNGVYSLNDQKSCGLYTPIERCQQYDIRTVDRCSTCQQGYVLQNNRCLPIPDFCASVDPNRRCLKCQSGYKLYLGACFSENLANCPLGTLPNRVDLFCQKVGPQNCIIDPTTNLCGQCNAGFTPVNGRCLKVLNVPTSCPIAQANSCCPKGFVFNNLCYQIEVINCNILAPSNIYCLACASGYVAMAGICLVPVKLDDVNCNVLAPQSDYCDDCNQEYLLDRNRYCHRDFNLNETNCPSPVAEFYNGNCIYKDIYCEIIDYNKPALPCLTCQESFFLVSGVCTRDACISKNNQGICTQAFQGYTLDSNNQPVKNPVNCISYNTSTQLCVRCSTFTRSVSISVNSAQVVCAYYDARCVEYNLFGSCVLCERTTEYDGYILKGRSCYVKATNCRVRDENDLSKCLTCASGYHLDVGDNTCYADQEGCEIYSQGSNCKQCLANSYVQNGANCYRISNLCSSYDSNGNCGQCRDGTLLPWRHTCVYFHPFCLNYDASGVCIQVYGGSSSASSGSSAVIGSSSSGSSVSGSSTSGSSGSTTSSSGGSFSFSSSSSSSSSSSGSSTSGRSTTGSYRVVGMSEAQRQAYRNFISRGSQASASADGQFLASYSGGAINVIPFAGIVHDRIIAWRLDGSAAACARGFQLQEGRCVIAGSSNCQIFAHNGYCVQCLPNFTLSSQYSCVSGLNCANGASTVDGRCSECASGYVMVGVQCFQIQSSTVVSSLVSQGSFFSFRAGSTASSEGSASGSAIAWPYARGCGIQNTFSRCEQCGEGFQLLSGKCVISTANCDSYSTSANSIYGDNGLCKQCSAGYIFWSGLCRLYNCQPAGQYCSSCTSNFIYSYGRCAPRLIDNCALYRDGICVVCNYGFYFSQDRTCKRVIPNCLDTYADTGRCRECRNTFTLYREGCVTAIRYCQDYNPDNTCQTCTSTISTRTQLINGRCGLLEGECTQLNAALQCISCSPGYSLYQQDGKIVCASLRTGCKTYDIRGRCEVCSPNYVLIRNRCYVAIPYCIRIDPVTEKCLDCYAPSVLSQGCCKINDDKCESFDFCRCQKCTQGYFLNNIGICQSNPNQCIIYNPTTQQCEKCIAGYYLYSGRCRPEAEIINGCQLGNNVTIFQGVTYECSLCKVGFELRSNKLCEGFNCLTANAAYRYCESCPLYYKLNFPPNPFEAYCIPYFCQSYVPNTIRCQINNTDYNGGHTITLPNKITIDYCTSPSTAVSCTSCRNYRYANNATSYGLCYPYNCVSRLQFNCQLCIPGFRLDSRYPGSCLADFCLSWNDLGRCLSCVPPYTPTLNGACENKGCCEVYDSNLGKCTQAKKYFILRNDICAPANCQQEDPNTIAACLKCKNGFYLTADKICRPSNCERETFSGTSCSQCNPGFTVNYTLFGVCTPYSCAEYTSFDYCLKCQPGFSLTGNRLCEANQCARFNPYRVCTACQPFYVLTARESCDPDCDVFQQGTCTCCSFGKTLNKTSNLCQDSADFCSKRDPISGLCNECLSPYVRVSSTCVASIPNCKTYSLVSCATCEPGYETGYPADNNRPSCLCRPKNCQQYNSNMTCQQCSPRFELNKDGLCVPRDCQYFSTTSWTCNGCYSRFDLVDGICVTRDCRVFENPAFNISCKLCESNDYGTFYSTPTSSASWEFQLVFGACYIRHCQNDPRQLFCTNCSVGYRSNSLGLCVCANPSPSNPYICVCPSGYNFNTTSGVCYIKRDVCLLERFSNGFCPSCPLKYNTIAGQCVPYACAQYTVESDYFVTCNQCYPNFNLIRNECVNKFCTKFETQSLNCTSCSDLYQPYYRYCVPKNCDRPTYDISIPECKGCSFGNELTPNKQECQIIHCLIEQNDKCLQCKDGYDYKTDLCLAFNCTQFEGLECTGCIEGFTLVGSFCKANNCQAYDKNNFCVTCNPGFKKVNGTCVRAFCKQDSPSACIECVDGYEVENSRNHYGFQSPILGICRPVNCKQASNDRSTCQACLDGMNRERGICMDTNCLQSSFDKLYKCQQCKKYFIFTEVASQFAYSICKFNPSFNFCPPGKYFRNNNCVDIPPPCIQMVPENECVECQPNHYLWENVCYEMSTCATWSYYEGCYECLPGYTLYKRWCIKSSIPNCQEYVGDQCTKCNSGFYLVSGQCFPLPSNCAQVNVRGECIACVFGYYLVSGQCISLPSNCLRVNIRGQCLECSSGYVLANGLCQVRDPFCATYDSTGCLACLEGYYLNTLRRCTLNPTNCKVASSAGVCLECFSGFVLINGLCQARDPFCASYDSTGCLACQEGYYLNTIRRCVINPPNCKVALSTGACSECYPNYVLTQGSCTPYIPPNPTCRQGYSFVGNQCVTPNCNRYNSASNSDRLCLECASGFTLSPIYYLCFKAVDNCASYSPTGGCLSCAVGFTLVQGLCRRPPLNCRVYDVITLICQECEVGYIFDLSGVNCVACPPGYSALGKNCVTPNCVTYTPAGLCSACTSGFILNSTSLCQPCPPGYWSQNNQCRTNNCTDYNVQGSCVKCAEGFTLQGRLCYKNIPSCQEYNLDASCLRCAPGFDLYQGLCYSSILYCTSYSLTGLCLSCSTGFQLSNGRCVGKVNNCIQYDISGFCLNCEPNYQLFNKLCYLRIPFCASYFADGSCQQCVSGYSLFNNRCYKEIPFCAAYSADGSCIRCSSNYVLQNGICYANIVGCLIYRPDRTCDRCDTGYNLSNGICIQVVNPPKHCIDYRQGICYQCSEGFVVSPDSKYCMYLNCEQQGPNDDICRVCRPFFSWFNNSECRFITDFCLIYQRGVCQSCQSGTQLSQNRCRPDFCQTYNFNAGLCQSCVPGYLLAFRRCWPEIPNCLQYDQFGRCVSCKNGTSLSNGKCEQSNVINCYAGRGSFCDRCQFRNYRTNGTNADLCINYPKYCINIDPYGNCISCCFGSVLSNGVCTRGFNIINCELQVQNKCERCRAGYQYCQFCEACLPSDPNCRLTNSEGKCTDCIQNFKLVNNVCKANPVGYVPGTTTCLASYQSATGDSCFKDTNDLRRLSSTGITATRQTGTPALLGGSVASSNSITSFTFRSSQQMVIFGILINNVGASSTYIVYFKNKASSPHICWNSCIPMGVESNNYVKPLNYPIVGTEVIVYVYGAGAGVSADFNVLLQ